MVSKIGFSCHSGGAKRRSLALRLGRRRLFTDPAKHLAPHASDPGPGLRPRRHQRHRIGCRGLLAKAERRRQGGMRPCRHRLPLLHLLGPELHQHLLGAAHHQRPMLPVLERRHRARAFCVLGHAANVGRPANEPNRARLSRLFRNRGLRGVRRAARRREAPDTRHLRLLRGDHRRRRRDLPRSADRRARLLGAQQRRPSDLHRRRARRLADRRRRLADRALLWFDAAGIAAYATYGAAKALAFGVAPVPAFAMGVMTACVGGIIRDVLAGEPSILMRPELYVTAAALSAGLFVGLTLVGLGPWLARRSQSSLASRCAERRSPAAGRCRNIATRFAMRAGIAFAVLLLAGLHDSAPERTAGPPRGRSRLRPQRRDRELRRGNRRPAVRSAGDARRPRPRRFGQQTRCRDRNHEARRARQSSTSPATSRAGSAGRFATPPSPAGRSRSPCCSRTPVPCASTTTITPSRSAVHCEWSWPIRETGTRATVPATIISATPT